MKQAEKNRLSREKIILAAITDFNESNSNNIHINNICKKYNISKGLIYHYFESKDDLLHSCLLYATTGLCNSINSFEVNKSAPLTENLYNYYKERIKYWTAHPHEYSIINYGISNYYGSNDSKILDSRKIFNEVTNKKLNEILSIYELHTEVSTEDLLSLMQMVYENMFMHAMDKIVAAIKNNNEELAAQKSNDLLKLYSSLIKLLTNGIIR